MSPEPLSTYSGGQDQARLLLLRACAGGMAGQPDQPLIAALIKVRCQGFQELHHAQRSLNQATRLPSLPAPHLKQVWPDLCRA